MNRVWKFAATASSYDSDSGVLNVTIDKAINLPKKFEDQDDPLVDQDAFVLMSAKVRVYTKEGKRVERVSRDEFDQVLNAAESVRVYAKMLPPHKWQKDEDGLPAPTLRAKKVYVLT